MSGNIGIGAQRPIHGGCSNTKCEKPTRSEGLYCSNDCKQAAYRRRLEARRSALRGDDDGELDPGIIRTRRHARVLQFLNERGGLSEWNEHDQEAVGMALDRVVDWANLLP